MSEGTVPATRGLREMFTQAGGVGRMGRAPQPSREKECLGGLVELLRRQGSQGLWAAF